MREDLGELWESIQARKWRVLEAVARLPEDVRLRKLRGSVWTPVQIVEHLVIVEEDGLLRIAEAAKSETPVKPKPLFGIGVRAMRLGVPLPVPPAMTPSGDPSLEALSRRWDEVRESLRAALEQENDRRAFALNPMMGPLGAGHLLELLDAHLQYHQRQLGAL